ncbi:MAG: adenosylmethionine decarboxylase [Clostridiales bacterium]|nr:adenosylmethionine decarboxylase [Clostridiales bacterium]
MTFYGFNNLTKSLALSIYDVCYTKTAREQKDYIAYIDSQYNAGRLTSILRQVADKIGARVINMSKHEYVPQGASATFLIAQEAMIPQETKIPQGGDTVVAHLDKSHLAVHTYPECHPANPIATFRVDIDVATCGDVTPLSTLDFLIGSFDSDVVTVDYRVRGFTRDTAGNKLFIDHGIASIQDFIDSRILARYEAADVNLSRSNIFHTRMLVKEVDLQNYLFNADAGDLPAGIRQTIRDSLRREMIEIYNGAGNDGLSKS